LEKNPAIDDAQEHILWGITGLRIMGLSLSAGLVIVFYLGIEVLANQTSHFFTQLTHLTFAIVLMNFVGILALRYAHDFRYKRSPTVRKQLRTAIDELKKLRRS
jgi:hypothetical protein